jgi:HPt (histidine-containing phosphotransfer) domain-containing protein
MIPNKSVTGTFAVNRSRKMQEENYKFINQDYLNDISAGNPAFVEVLLMTFQDEAKRFISQLTGQLARDEYNQIQKAAHAMKPTGAYIGVNALTILVGNLEKAAQNENRDQSNSIIGQIKNMVGFILKEIEEYLSHSAR